MDDPARNPYIKESDVGNLGTLGGESSLQTSVRTGQIITLALIMSVVSLFCILGLIVFGKEEEPEPEGPLLLWIGVGAGFAACVASVVISMVMRGPAVQEFRARCGPDDATESDDQIMSPAVTRLMGALMTGTLISQSILDSAALINLIFMVIDRNLLHLVVAGVMVIGILMLTPTIGKRRAAIEEGMR